MSDQYDVPTDPDLIILAVFERANAYFHSGQFEEALKGYAWLITLLRNGGPEDRLAACLMNQGTCLARLGRHEAGLAALNEALPLFQQQGLLADLALCKMNQGLCLNAIGRHEAAIAAFDEALPLLWQYGLPVDFVSCLMNLGNGLNVLGRHEDALAVYDEILPLMRRYASPSSLARCLMNRATCLDDLGRHEDALTVYEEALPLYREHALPADLARCLVNQGNCLTRLGRHEDALAAYEEALPLFQVPADIALCLMNRANGLARLGRHECALAVYDEILPLMRQHALPADLARCMMNRAISLDELGRHEDALAAYNEVLPLFQNPADLALCKASRANCLTRLGRHEDALAAYEEALVSFGQYLLPFDFAAGLMNRATCLFVLGRYAEALDSFDHAFITEDRASATLQFVVHRVATRTRTASQYRLAAKVALSLNQPDRAWGYVQRAKGRTLMDLLGARAEETARDRLELLLVQQRGAGKIDEKTFSTAMTRISDQRVAQRQSRFGRDARAPMSLDSVVAALRTGEALLDVFTIDDDGTLRLFLLQHGQPSVCWTGPVEGTVLSLLMARWEEARQHWLEAMDAIASINKQYPGTNPGIVARRNRVIAERGYYDVRDKAAAVEQKVLVDLGDLVLARMLKHLDHPVTTLIVSSDGLLHRLSLGAVTLPDAKGSRQPLIDRFDLQLVPTATSLAILRGQHGPRVTWPAALLAAAPFATEEPGDGSRSLASLEPAVHPAFLARDVVRVGTTRRKLPASGPEINVVAQLLESAGGTKTVIPTAEATRPRLEADLPGAHILHLATHGGALELGESVMDYQILLAGETVIQVRELYDGVVQLRDVFLVTLSACSLGQVILKGAESSGFVQALLQAGAGVVLAPLWAVDDHATMLLMVKFYEELTGPERHSVATAWRRACHWMRTQTDYDHPVYWAGFLPSGNAAIRLTATT